MTTKGPGVFPFPSSDITCKLVGIADSASGTTVASMKLLGASYLSKITALDRSNPFGLELDANPPWPDTW